MLLKLIGALTVVFSAIATSFGLCHLFSERIRQLEGFLKLLRHTREHIACFRTPTPEIFAAFRNAALDDAGFLTPLCERGFSAALSESRARLLLDGEELAPLVAFAEALGGGYTEEETARCDLAIAAVERSLCERREGLPRLLKLCRTLMLGAGLALVIVLI